MSRQHISQGSSFERDYGYSRAVVDGEWVFVSGTTGYDYATMTIAEDIEAQLGQTLANIEAALREADSAPGDIVRVRYYLADAAEFERCQPQIHAFFAASRPAATMIEARLIDDRIRIEIEVTARRQSGP